MSRFRTSFATATTGITGRFFDLLAPTTGSILVRRVTLGFFGAASPPTSQQVQFAAQPGTGVTAIGTSITAGKLRSTSVPALGTSGAGTLTGTFAAAGPPFLISLNTQSAADLPWEQLEEWEIPASSDLQFQVITNAVPSGAGVTVTVEWEE